MSDTCCGHRFKNRDSFRRHNSKFHPKNVLPSSRPSMVCGVCHTSFANHQDLEAHLEKEHDVPIVHEQLTFGSVDEFESWLRTVEEKEKAKFIRRNFKKTSSDGRTVVYYRCNRSGQARERVPEQHRKREMKIQGTVKTGFQCPARVTSWILSTGMVKVDFCKTHAFHTMELKHLPLPSPKKKEIAAKIAAKIPLQEILLDIKETAKTKSTSSDGLDRMHLVNMQDLRNIIKEFRLDSKKQFHPDDVTSVEAWVMKEMAMGEDSCVILYKPKGDVEENCGFIAEGDFLLGIMTPSQQEMLRKFGKDGIVCVDSTHGTNNFQLTTLLVLDDLGQGFPAAFFFSNCHDAPFLEVFLNCVKEKVGCIRSKTFMSDMADSFYNAWAKVMGECEFRLHCTWHVVRAWQEKLLKTVKSESKRTEVYNRLHTLLTLTDEESFKIMCSSVISFLEKDPEMSEFASYFIEHCLTTSQRWAYCYRVNAGINTNMSFERLHHSIKHIFLRGKVGTRLDATIHALTRLIDRKVFDRLICLEKGKLSYKLRELRLRHKTASKNYSKFKDQVLPDGESGKKWIVPSFETCEQYSVVNVQNGKCCQLYCRACDACIHQYTCTCRDFCIKSNMCKHVHLVIKLQSSAIICEPEYEEMAIDDEGDDEDSYSLHLDEGGNETMALLNTICRAQLPDSDLEDMRTRIQNDMISLLDSIKTKEGLLTFEKTMNNVKPLLQASDDIMSPLV